MPRISLEELRNADLYTQKEAARYLCLSASTLRYWAFGETTQNRTVSPLILTSASSNRLSFYNLIELHLLGAMTRLYKVNLKNIRRSLIYVSEQLGVERPLLTKTFETDGVDLFVEHYGRLLNATKKGQQAMQEVLKNSLMRIERDDKMLPTKLFPYTRPENIASPHVIAMTPLLNSGRPVINRTGISTLIVTERYKAGDSVVDLADDYGVEAFMIEEAIRCELTIAA